MKKNIIEAEKGMKFTNVKIINGGSAIEVYIEPEKREKYKEKTLDDFLELIEVSSLSKRDKVFRYKPENHSQEIVKKGIFKAIDMNLKDFMVFTISPSLDENDKLIYKEGTYPIIEKSVEWLYEKCQKLYPERNSRIGDENHYYAFLGYLIKYLVEKKKQSIDDAWFVVCDDSKSLGNFLNTELIENELEKSGSRAIGKFYDLGNTYKIIRDSGSETKFSLAGGCYKDLSYLAPLSNIVPLISIKRNMKNAVPWIVCDEYKKIKS